MSEPDGQLADIFRDEATQRLDHMDETLLAVESGHAEAEAVDSLFRDAHTIKGAASMLGFDDIGMLAHAAEDILGLARASGAFPPDLAAPLLRATAALGAMVAGSAEPIDDLITDLAARGAAISGGGGGGAAPPAEPPPADRGPRSHGLLSRGPGQQLSRGGRPRRSSRPGTARAPTPPCGSRRRRSTVWSTFSASSCSTGAAWCTRWPSGGGCPRTWPRCSRAASACSTR